MLAAMKFGNMRKLIAMWAIVVTGVWVLAWLIGNFSAPDRCVKAAPCVPRTPVEVLSTWDGKHYEAIARRGYSAQGAESRNLAFFPLFPLVARLFGGDRAPVLAGILLNQLCLLGSVLLIGHEARDGKEIALCEEQVALYEEPGFWLLVSPLAFFLSAFYADSLFLFLTLLMVATYRKGLFGPACVVGILAGLTRPTAVCLPALFITDVISRLKRGDRWRSIAPSALCFLAPLLAVLLYVGYVGWVTGAPFTYYQIQANWDTHQDLPFLQLARDLRFNLSEIAIGNIHGWEIVRLLSSFSIFALMLWGWKKLDPSFLVYLITAMLFIHSLARDSTARYELVLFPVFILLSQFMTDRPRIARISAIMSLALQITLFVRYADWKWVA
jgi:Gpi18-like mannosyltransferase